MNFWSVGPQLCPWTLCSREQPLESATRTSVAAMTPIRRKMHGSSARRAGHAITRSRRALRRSPLLEDERAVHARAAHPDGVVEGDGRRVLGPHEEADGRCPRKEKATEVGEAALSKALAADGRVDPDLLELHGP